MSVQGLVATSMAAINSTAVHQASTSRGSLLYMPLCSASTTCPTSSHLELTISRVCRARTVRAAISRDAATAVVAAAAVLEPESKSREAPPTLDPAVWLNSDISHAFANRGLQSTASSGSMGHSSHSGHYLGVHTAEDSVAGPTVGSNSGSQSTKKSASSSSRKKSQPRGRPNSRAVQRLKAQYSSLFEQLEAEHTAMLHKHERDFMNLLYSGASQQHLEQQRRQHDMMLHKLKSKYSQKWGSPVARKSFFQAAEPQQQQQQKQQHTAPSNKATGHTHAVAASQRQQQQNVTSEEVSGHRQAALTPQGILQQQQQQSAVVDKVGGHKRAAAASQRRQQQQHRSSTASPPSTSSSRNRSSSHTQNVSASSSSTTSSSRRQRSGSKASVGATCDPVYSELTFSAFDIPDDTPEVIAAAAAAQEEAAEVQRFTNQMVGAKVIADALSQDPMDVKTLDELEIVFLHLALPKLVDWKLGHLMIKLAKYLLARPDRDAHTFGSVFNAFALANRTDLALATWEKLSGQGVDIGPYGSSALVKACARQRDVAAALQVFDQLLRRRVTFNSYTYNCLLQLCCCAGRVEDALAVYNLQRLETSPGSLPDAWTYNALMRGVLVSGRVELTQQLFENMLEDGVTADPPLYCNFLNAAGRAGSLGLARYLYQHMLLTLDLEKPQQQQQQQQQQLRKHGQHGMSQRSISSSSTWADASYRVDSAAAAAADGPLAVLIHSGGDGSDTEESEEPNMLLMVNALLFAHAQVGALQGALAVYRQELLGRGLHPDAYTCTALLTAAARSSGPSWSDVQHIVAIMQQYGIGITTQLGTALVNAYRRVKVWHWPAAGGSKGEQQQQQQQQQQGASIGSSPSKTRAAADESSSRNSDEAVLQLTSQLDQQQLLTATGAPALPNVEPVVAAALHAARQVLLQLHQQKLATSNSYVTMLCFLLEQGQVGSFKQLYGVMVNGGIHPDDQGWEKLMYASDECGMQDLLLRLRQEQELRRRQVVATRTRPSMMGQGQ